MVPGELYATIFPQFDYVIVAQMILLIGTSHGDNVSIYGGQKQ